MSLQSRTVYSGISSPGVASGRIARNRFVPAAKATVSRPGSFVRPSGIKTVTAPYRATDATIKDILSLYKSMLHEYDYKVPKSWIEGSIPEELSGTYFRNGPGMQVNNPRYKRHTFDGDGMILSFEFNRGDVRFSNKYVRTKGFLDEQAAGRPVHRTAFTRGAADGSMLFNPFDFQLKNVANTGVVHWGDKLLALYETGLPHQLDPATLNTLGETDLNGQLISSVLAAHYRVMPGGRQQQQQQIWEVPNSSSNGRSSGSNGTGDAAAGRTLLGFSFNPRMGDAELVFYEFAESGSLAVTPVSYRLPGIALAMIHDIAVTEDYYIAVVAPVNFNPLKFLSEYFTSQCSIAECLVYDPSQPTKIHLIPRPKGAAAGTQPYILDAPPMFTFHHANAFQIPANTPEGIHSNGNSHFNSYGNGNGHSNGNGHNNGHSSSKQLLVLDTVAWDTVAFEANQYTMTADYYKGGNRAQLRRFVFELDPFKALSSSSSTGRLIRDCQLARRCMEFPTVNWDFHGQPHRHIYCSADTVDHEVYWGPTQAVMKLSLSDPLVGTQGPVSSEDVDLDIWDAGKRRLVMEPMFVPHPEPTAEDHGWILATIHNAATGNGELVILDAQEISAGPVATIHFQHFLPAGLHGSFTPKIWGNVRGDGMSAEPEWREPNVVRAV